MTKWISAAAAVAMACGWAGGAQAAYIVTFEQTASGVTATGQGSFLTTGLASSDMEYDSARVSSGSGLLNLQSTGTENGKIFAGLNYFGSGLFGFGNNVDATTQTGPGVGFSIANDTLVVPRGYVSGSQLSTSIVTFENSTYATLGLRLGTYDYSYNTTSGVDLITVQVSGVPLPASAPLFGAALLSLAALAYRRKLVRSSEA